MTKGFFVYLWSPARYTAMFLVFGISTFGVMLSLLYLCSVNPNTGKSISKFNTVCSKNKLFNHRKGKKRHLSWQIIINFYVHLCLHLISPSLPFLFLVLDSWLMAQVTETSNDPNSVVQINHTHLCWIEKKIRAKWFPFYRSDVHGKIWWDDQNLSLRVNNYIFLIVYCN